MTDPRRTLKVAPVLAITLGTVALAARPPGTTAGLSIILAVGLAGLVIPLQTRPATSSLTSAFRPKALLVVAIGVAAFALARLLHAPPRAPALLPSVVATVLAALAEEAFFRRLVYGWLSQWGALLAIVGAATIFGAVHISGYGSAALPVNLAVGLLFGWQRWATNGWGAPAATHAVANLLQIR